MNLGRYDSKDFWAGVLFLATGVAALAIAQGYRFGSTLRMGPGYFPSVLGGLLIVFGLYVMARGLRSRDSVAAGWSVRALIMVPLSLILFGMLMDRAGFVPALASLIFGSAVAGREFRFREVLLLAVVLTGLSVAVFIWGLGLPYPLFQGL